MNHAKGLLAIFLACNATTVNASLGGDWLSVYACENESDFRACRTCKPSSDMKVRFVVDQKKSTVIIQVRESSTTHPPNRLNDCVVIDERNWSCTSKSEFQWNSDGMASGVYSTKKVFLNRGDTYYTAFSCAK